jgi:hypothetical protein
MKAVEARPSLRDALTPEQFRTAFCLSPAIYDALKRCRLAPREVRTAAGIMIPLECIAAWRCEIEPLRLFAERWLSRYSKTSVDKGARTAAGDPLVGYGYRHERRLQQNCREQGPRCRGARSHDS